MVSEKVSEPVSKKFDTEKWTSTGIENIWYRTKYWYRYRLSLWVPSHTGTVSGWFIVHVSLLLLLVFGELQDLQQILIISITALQEAIYILAPWQISHWHPPRQCVDFTIFFCSALIFNCWFNHLSVIQADAKFPILIFNV